MSRFLITGGAGFIGSNIAEYLHKNGHFVRILDDFSSGTKDNLNFINNNPQNAEIIKGDITNPDECRRSCQGIDYVLHHAGLLSVPQSLIDPLNCNRINIDGTVNMLRACVDTKVKRFVFASSSSIYGDTDRFPEHEDDKPCLISPYALSKLTGEYYCRIFSEQFDLKTVCLRYFNVYGPKQSTSGDYALVIPKFIDLMLKDQQPPIYGSGLQSRDFIYINDVISANILAATADGIDHDVFNVASGQEYSVLDIVNELNGILGKSIQPKFLPVRSGDAFRTSADISKIGKTLRYQPSVSLKEGLRETVEYFKRS